jgi:hypothetical protein
MPLLQRLPWALKFAWGLFVVGCLLLAAGFFAVMRWASFAGVGCSIAGYALAIADMLLRKRRRSESAGFYAAIMVVPTLALLIVLLLGLIGAAVLAVHYSLHGFSASKAVRFLHLMGSILAVIACAGISKIASAADASEAEPGEGT